MMSSEQIGKNLSAKLKPNLLYFVIIFFFPIAKSKDLAINQIYPVFRFITKPRYSLYTLLAFVVLRVLDFHYVFQ
jgi:hypothetical protein